jgi:Zn-dependent peptidase ImmA (M78 family)
VCAREGVRLVLRSLAEEAQLVGYRGAWTIGVNCDLPPRRHAYYAAHELGHLWLHVDQAEGRRAVVFNFGAYGGDDPREDDAELMATLLCQGRALRGL